MSSITNRIKIAPKTLELLKAFARNAAKTMTVITIGMRVLRISQA